MQIRQVGDPILAQPAALVPDVKDPAIQALIEDLSVTLRAANGVGIAAPQVGIGSQVLIVASRPNPRYPDAPQMDPLPILNPHLLWWSDEQEWGWEGCLSVPNQRGLVARAQAVAVEFQDRQGRRQTAEWSGFVARIFQHEFDHLLGKVFLERDPKRLLSEADYQAQIVPPTSP